MSIRLVNPIFAGSSHYFAIDPIVAAWELAVESADGQPLEQGVVIAVNAFVVGCKADAIWGAIKTCGLLAGARTLAGALVPLVGSAPTNAGGLFVAGDYDRKTGLKSDGTKYLDSNRAGDADPQDNNHIAAWLSQKGTVTGAVMGSRNFANATGSTQMVERSSSNDDLFGFISRSSLAAEISGATNREGLIGMSRSASASFAYRVAGSSGTSAIASQTPSSLNYFVFNRSGTSLPGNARIAFYSIGEAIDLAKLDARVSTLIAAIGAAIP